MAIHHFSYDASIPEAPSMHNTLGIEGESVQDAQVLLEDYLEEKYRHLHGSSSNIQEVSEEQAKQIALDSWSPSI